MAEKRKLLAEIEKVFKKIDEGVEIFEETMGKMLEANSENQREKYQDDLKKEIKKLQRLRDQVKNWQNSSEIKDKEKLTQYRKVIEQRMEQFKDVERENKTKPHSKQGLCAEEKMDPKDKERFEMVDWISNMIRVLNDESDKVEAVIESLSSAESGRRRNKPKEDVKKLEKEKELRTQMETIKFHSDKLEVCMRLVNNESLDPTQLSNVKESLEVWHDGLSGNPEESQDLAELSEIYEDLHLAALTGAFGKHSSVDEERNENGVEAGNGSGSPVMDERDKSRHSSADPSTAAPVKRTTSVTSSVSSLPATPLKLTSQPSVDTPPAPPTPPPPPPGIPYSIAAAAAARTAAPSAVVFPLQSKQGSPLPSLPRQVAPLSEWQVATTAKDEKRPHPALPPVVPAPVAERDGESGSGTGEEADVGGAAPSTPSTPSTPAKTSEKLATVGVAQTSRVTSMTASPAKSFTGTDLAIVGEELRSGLLRLEKRSAEPQTALIPPQLGASPLGRTLHAPEHESNLLALEQGLLRLPLQVDSERPRSYLPKMPCPTPSYYPQQPPVNADSMEYYLRLSPETLFFTFYYMEGSRAQLLAAKALKKLSWRFHTKYLMWFQRHEEPKQITDDFEEGTYVYFDFEKWSQRKKEQFRFEYRYLEDKELD